MQKLKKKLGKVVPNITVSDLNKDKLDTELYEWKQSRLEDGKFPCRCGHFESSHIKRMCIACHGKDGHTESSYEDDGLSVKVGTCYHDFEPMDNLTIVEWMAQHRKDIEK
jgi:hypothetical protein